MEIWGFVEVFGHYGLLAAIVVFFIWQTSVRESKCEDRVKQLESRMNETLLRSLNETTVQLTRSTDVIERNSRVMEDLERVLRDR